jgi:carbonic anhydrase
MHRSLLLLLLAAASPGLAQISMWQLVARDAQKRVEVDRARIGRDGQGQPVGWSRIVLATPASDSASGRRYVVVEALNRYDCEVRNFSTLRRVLLDSDDKVIREERIQAPGETRVVPGTLDERLYEQVCRPEAGNRLQHVAEAAATAAKNAQRSSARDRR